ncbi:putative lipid II flippase FtsW [Jeotgalibacillus proteolyticus]|uniref:Probable peptidoglycan glycosyltransferase FtsW n=1 Tax=Jeotgalibacillus proteolyticus TaxID=2082395 RepID=A0A2S5GD99_9BACL|nr:putative lipid II flippase FtsW [Jeotgalibacillus proteolyticus]PPA70873.1 putative lipid II flippase FtsW [Jeotgalibacillus proteolyticus]
MKKLISTFHGPLFMVVVGMGLFGLIMVYSASYFVAQESTGTHYAFVLRQGIWWLVALGAFLFTSLFKFTAYQKLLPFIVVGTFIMLLLVFIPSLGEERNYATRWVSVGPILLQPSEIAKLTVPLYISYILVQKRAQLHDFKKGILPSLIIVLLLTFLILLQPDLGTVISILIAYLAMLLVGKISFKHVFGLGLAGIAAVTMLAILSPYRLERLTNFRDPFADPGGGGYQLIQSLSAIASGGITGSGFGMSTMKLGFLPEPHTDFIIAIIAEELGIFGIIAIITGFVALLLIGYSIYTACPHPVGKLLAIGITAQILGQACMNLAAAVGLMPITGITLPLISYGGSSLIITMTMLGILMNIARYNHFTNNKKETKEIYETV